MSTSKKIGVIAAIVFTLLISSPTNAAGTDSQIPELNPFCWHRIDCHNTRKQFLTGAPSCTAGDPLCKELEQGFISNASVAPCTGGEGETQWGRCLPAGTTKTEISFGGREEFTNIGDFIIVMYKYLVTIASIVAVVMIIIAGMQWVTSGGNSEAISSAKKRIGGAIIGLFIAYMSYFVLNTINPALVNLRLPQVWLAKPIELMPEFCADIPGATEGKIMFAYVAASDQPRAPLIPLEKRNYIPLTENTYDCGSRYVAENGGESTCFENFCDMKNNQRQMCAKNDPSQGGYDCVAGDLIIHYFVNTTDFTITESILTELEKVPIVNWFVSNAMHDEWLSSDVVVRAVCSSPGEGSSYYLAKNPSQDPGGSVAANITAGYYSTQVAAKEWTSRIKSRPIHKDGYWEYVDVYSGLTDPELIKNSFNCSKLTSGREVEGEVVGYFIRQVVLADQSILATAGEVAKNIASFGYWGNVSPRPNLNIGYFNGAVEFGTFDDDISSLGAFIPLDKLKASGLQFKVGLTLDKFKKMLGKTGNVPHE